MRFGRIKLLICIFIIFLTSNINASESSSLVKIIDREIVEWQTISRTTPICGMRGCITMHYPKLNQIGTKYKVKFAQIKWKGQIKEIELERNVIGSDEPLKREIAESPFNEKD